VSDQLREKGHRHADEMPISLYRNGVEFQDVTVCSCDHLNTLMHMIMPGDDSVLMRMIMRDNARLSSDARKSMGCCSQMDFGTKLLIGMLS